VVIGFLGVGKIILFWVLVVLRLFDIGVVEVDGVFLILCDDVFVCGVVVVL